MNLEEARIHLEKSISHKPAALLDASDFAVINTLPLIRLNELINLAGHEHYAPSTTLNAARAQVISLINLGHLSALSIYGVGQYA